MPVILDPSADALWPDPHFSPDALRSLFVPFTSDRMEAVPDRAWPKTFLVLDLASREVESVTVE